MAQYSVHRLTDGSGYVIDLQSSAVDYLNTRVVAPLYLKSEYSLPLERSNPEFVFGGETYVMLTQYLATVHRSELGELIADLTKEDHRITRALDLILHGV
jgi:toxin CcdB